MTASPDFQLAPARPAVRLVPLGERDLSWLFQFATEYPEQWPRMGHGGPRPFPEFRGLVWAGTAALYRVDGAVPDRPDVGRLLGLVGIYNLNQSSGVAWLERVDLPNAERDLMDTATDDVLAMAAKAWPLRRLFVEYYDCCPSPLSGRPGVNTHGRLTEHGFFRGARWDLVYESVVLE
jgi:hypothetical protein